MDCPLRTPQHPDFPGHGTCIQVDPLTFRIYGEDTFAERHLDVTWVQQNLRFTTYVTHVGRQVGVWISCGPAHEKLILNPDGPFSRTLGVVWPTGSRRFCRVNLRLFHPQSDTFTLPYNAPYFTEEGETLRRDDDCRDRKFFPVTHQEDEDNRLVQIPFPLTSLSSTISGSSGRDRMGTIFDNDEIRNGFSYCFIVKILE